MRLKRSLLLSLPFFITLTTTPLTALSSSYRLHAHLVLKDPKSALAEWNALALEKQTSLEGKRRRIEILCALADRSEALKALKEYAQASSLPLLEHRDLLEEIAWMTVRKSCSSSSLLTRAMAILTAGVGNDSRGVQVIVEALASPHAILRKIAADVAGQMHDDCLQEAIMERFSQEWVWEVRQSLLKAIQQMKIISSRERLLSRIKARTTSEEERACLICTYLALMDTMEPELLEPLLNSVRSNVRALACPLCVEKRDNDSLKLLEVLLDDPHPQVQIQALQTLGLYADLSDRKRLADRVALLTKQNDKELLLTAAWFLAPVDSKTSLNCIKSLLNDSEIPVRHFAVGVLSTLGQKAIPLLQSCLESKDAYVHMNAALALLSLRTNQGVCCAILEKALASRERWMWREQGFFRAISPSTLTPKEEIPDYPEAMNQLTRLEVLHHLIVARHPGAKLAMKRFLQESVWSITGQLAALAVMEGDKEVIEEVYRLEKDPNPRIAIQAAFVLSLWSKDPRSISLLEANYSNADHGLKGMILEAVGRIGHESSLPFLVRALEEPSEQIRIIAAMALLSCLQQS